MAKPFAWSYTGLSDFESCPKKFYHLRVAKDVKDDDNSFSAEGKKVHDAMYQRVFKGKDLPLELARFESLAAKLEALPGRKDGEMKLALNRKFESRGFFDPDVWVRGVCDFLCINDTHALIVDYKTGKEKDDFTQLSMTAAILQQSFPKVSRWTIAFCWMQQGGKMTKRILTTEDHIETWSDLLPRVERIESALRVSEFPAKKSGLCSYCPVTSCVHHARRS
jgi:hypothetical protein